MTPQELKNSILQRAVQGKLVPQDSTEGTGEELYQQMQKEKQNLIKEGKIKKEKPLPEISADELPFDLPESWAWARVGNIGSWSAGATPSRTNSEYYGGNIPWLKTGDLNDGYVSEVPESITTLALEKTSVRLNPAGSVLMAMYGATIGKLAIIEIPMTTNQACCACIPYGDMFNKYLFYYLMGMRRAYIKMGEGGAQPNISKEKIVNSLIPLPPLNEQKRIVAKIEELLPLIDRYEQAWTKLEEFNKHFPIDMQKSILQRAIQGKLVPQVPSEGTGEELYKQIQEEKKALIKAGKIKKEKPLPEITEEDIPFEIPENWKWVRIGKVFNLQAGKNKTSTEIYEEPSPEHNYQCYGGNGCRGYVSDYNRSGHYALIGRQGALCGNINYANGNFYATEHAVVVEQFAETDVLWCGYFLKALNLNQYATATAQPGLAVANINQVPIPLPPIAEQKRIVKKIEELLLLCERLK